MPSKNHRINLTVPEDVYQAIMNCKEQNGGCFSTATLTLALVIHALRDLDYVGVKGEDCI